uniref:Chorein N-terminal domain-containing protein n=1 Tax=Aureoumbra lagunensis TaxID=44058 RepID=A0A7S3K2Q0_9STRA
MLTYLLEKFVRRLCGRWLRKFSSDQVNITMGGRMEFSDLWLETEELKKMILPFDIIGAHAAELIIDVPLSSSGTLYIRICDVDMYAKATNYEIVEAEAARRALEIAINLYWTNYLRAPQGADATSEPAALAETIASVVKSAKIEINRIHVRLASTSPRFALADNQGFAIQWGFIIESICISSDSQKEEDPEHEHHRVYKDVDVKNIRLYCRPFHESQEDNNNNIEQAIAEQKIYAMRDEIWQESISTARRGWFSAATESEKKKKLIMKKIINGEQISIKSMHINAEASLEAIADAIREIPAISSCVTIAAMPEFSLPWLAEFSLDIHTHSVHGSISSLFVSVLLDAQRRLERSHAARQDVACRVLGRGRIIGPTAASAKGLPQRPKRLSSLGSESSSSSSSSLSSNPGEQELFVDDDESEHVEDPRTPELELEQQQNTFSSIPVGISRRLWAKARAAFFRDSFHKQRAQIWRRWFREWVIAGRYVAVRKLLAPHLRCGVFRSEGEAYYELNETCCVTRGGKFYVHPAQLSHSERVSAQELLANTTQNYLCDESQAMRESVISTGGKSSKRVDPRTAVALYAEQLYLDAILPANIAAALRAIARRHTRASKDSSALAFARKYALEKPCLVFAPIAGENLPISYVMSSELRVDVELLADDETIIASGRCEHASSDGFRFKPSRLASKAQHIPAWNADDECPIDSFLELPLLSTQTQCSLRIKLIDRGGPFESVVAISKRPYPRIELDINRPWIQLHDSSERQSCWSSISGKPKPLDLRLQLESSDDPNTCFCLEVAASYCLGRDAPVARKSLQSMLIDRRAEQKRNGTRPRQRLTTLNSVKFQVTDISLALDDHLQFKASSVQGESARGIHLSAAPVHAPAGTGEGSVLAAVSRFLLRLFSSPAENGALLWQARDAIFTSMHNGKTSIIKFNKCVRGTSITIDKEETQNDKIDGYDDHFIIVAGPDGNLMTDVDRRPVPWLPPEAAPGTTFFPVVNFFFPGGIYELIDTSNETHRFELQVASADAGLDACTTPALYAFGRAPLIPLLFTLAKELPYKEATTPFQKKEKEAAAMQEEGKVSISIPTPLEEREVSTPITRQKDQREEKSSTTVPTPQSESLLLQEELSTPQKVPPSSCSSEHVGSHPRIIEFTCQELGVAARDDTSQSTRNTDDQQEKQINNTHTQDINNQISQSNIPEPQPEQVEFTCLKVMSACSVM